MGLTMAQRSGRPYERNKAIIRRNAEQCWRCGRPLDPNARRGEPGFVTVGHLLAVEDGGTDQLNNLAPECAPCNYGDGANRTNRKRRGQPASTWTNPNW